MAAEETRMQEKASEWIFKKTLSIGSKDFWATAEDLINDKRNFKEICSIYPALKNQDESEGYIWLQSFIAQSKTMRQQFVQGNWKPFDEFDRDTSGGFMDYISHAANQCFGISQKDTWNPADIWCIRNMKEVRKMIEDPKVLGPKNTWGKPKLPQDGIYKLNEALKTLYRNGKIKSARTPAVVGISLKKITPTPVTIPGTKKKKNIYIAHYEEVNINDNIFKTQEFKTDFQITRIALNMLRNDDAQRTVDKETKEKKKITSFGTQDMIIRVVNELHKSGKTSGQTFDFTIKPVSTSSFNNLKFEPTLKGAGSARIGKAPVKKVLSQLARSGIPFSNEWRDYPKDLNEYKATRATYAAMWTTVKSATGPISKIIDKSVLGESWQEVDKLIQHTYTPSSSKSPLGSSGGGEPWIGCAKLMELDLLAKMVRVGRTKEGMAKINTAFTWLSYSAQKKNRIVTGKFGPFGKLY